MASGVRATLAASVGRISDRPAIVVSVNTCCTSVGPSVSRTLPNTTGSVPISVPPAIAAASEPPGGVPRESTSPPLTWSSKSGA